MLVTACQMSTVVCQLSSRVSQTSRGMDSLENLDSGHKASLDTANRMILGAFLINQDTDSLARLVNRCKGEVRM